MALLMFEGPRTHLLQKISRVVWMMRCLISTIRQWTIYFEDSQFSLTVLRLWLKYRTLPFLVGFMHPAKHRWAVCRISWRISWNLCYHRTVTFRTRKSSHKTFVPRNKSLNMENFGRNHLLSSGYKLLQECETWSGTLSSLRTFS